jgi:orotidine-5'-phosphate decarboxylase
MGTSFGERLDAGIARRGGLCVGIDPHPATLEAWGLPVDANGAERLGRALIAAAAGRVAIVKPQVSLFECFGAAGFAALERTIAAARAAGLLVIADAKRGDIGSSNAGYARAWLGETAPFACDALTVSPYLGVGALLGLKEAATLAGAGLFVLAATSNLEADATQGTGDPSVAARIAAAVGEWSEEEAVPGPLGSFGIVFGATGAPVARGLDIRRTSSRLPVLAPGFGAQGATLHDAGRLFPGARHRLLASVSRAITAAGPERAAATIETFTTDLADGWNAAEEERTCPVKPDQAPARG